MEQRFKGKFTLVHFNNLIILYLLSTRSLSLFKVKKNISHFPRNFIDLYFILQPVIHFELILRVSINALYQWRNKLEIFVLYKNIWLFCQYFLKNFYWIASVFLLNQFQIFISINLLFYALSLFFERFYFYFYFLCVLCTSTCLSQKRELDPLEL